MKKLKWFVTIVVTLVIAIVVAGYVVLSTMEFEDLRETIQAEAKKATGRDLTIAGPIDLAVSWTPAIAIEDVTFANADWGSRPAMVKLNRLEVEVALLPLLSGEVEIRRLVVVHPDILLETDAQGTPNWSLEGIAEAAEEVAEEGGPEAETTVGGMPILNHVTIEDGVLTYRDGQTGEEMIVELNELTSSAGGVDAPVELNLNGSYNGEPFSLSGRLGAFTQLKSGPFPVDLQAAAGDAIFTIKGAVAQPLAGQGLDLKVSAKGESLASIGALAGTDLPPLGPYDVAARIKADNLDGGTLSLSEFAAKIGGSDLTGQATLAMNATPPAVSGSFSSQLLDVADFAPPGGGEADAAETAQGGGPESPYVFTEEPLPLDGLKAVDANLKFDAATLRLKDKLELKDFDLTLKLAGGRLAIAPLTTGFANGTLEASVDLDGSKATPSLVATLKGADIDYGQLLRDMEIEDSVKGTMGLDVDLRGAGGSPRAIAAGLNGKTEIVSDEGVVSNRLLKIVGVGLSNILGPLMGSDDDAKLNCIVSRFTIEKGLATSNAMIFDSEAFTVIGAGTVDLKTEELDLHMDTSSREASIASLAVPFNVGGTLKSPSFTPDPLGTALGAAKIVGMFVVPPLAIGELVAEHVVADAGENPCVAALNAAESGEAPKEKSTMDSITEQPAKAIEGVGEGVGKALKGVGEGLKNLLGD